MRPGRERLYRRDSGVLADGDLAVASPLQDVPEERLALAVGQLADGTHQQLHALTAGYRERGVLGGVGFMMIFEWSARAPRASRVACAVADDRKKPGTELVWPSARGNGPVGVEHRLLYDLLSEIGVSPQAPHGEPQQYGAVRRQEHPKDLRFARGNAVHEYLLRGRHQIKSL